MKHLQDMLLVSLLAVTAFCLAPVKEVRAEDRQPEIISGHTFYEEELPRSEITVTKQTKAVHFGARTTGYAKYTNDFFYNRLTFEEKALYNALYDICDGYLTGTADVSLNSRYSLYFTEQANYEGLTKDRAKKVALLFDVNNPQFYFLADSVLAASTPGTTEGYIALSVYPSFANGQTRRATTANLFARISALENQVIQEKSDFAKVRRVHDLLCESISYDTDTSRTELHQSCYTAFMTGQSVCAGYTEAAELLLNAAGVPTIAVTSDLHEWNQVFLGGYWYLLDVTWDDQDFGIIYNYFLKSDATAQAVSYQSQVYHTREDFWEWFLCPPCRYDYGNTATVLPEPTEQIGYIFTDRVDIGNRTGVRDGAVQMYRLYNKNSGEHFYTANDVEATGLKAAGWVYEGRAWIAPTYSTQPVYRLYNSNAGEHHYTLSEAERELLIAEGWRDEGIGWYSDDRSRVPLYRVYNTNQFANNHFFTMNSYERDALVSAGWIDEGIAWYGE